MAKKRYYTMKLNGEHFILDTKETVSTSKSISRLDITDAYARPSSTKIAIFNEWRNWFISNDGFCGVSFYNSNFFSIEGFVFDKETNQEYYCVITRTYNRCWRVA